MKKIINKIINNSFYTFILGMLLCSGIAYGTNTYESNTIEYSPTDASWEVSNVNDAINSLYSMKTELDNIKGIGDATAADIASGKTAVVNGEIVTGTAITDVNSILTTQSRTTSHSYNHDNEYGLISKSVTFSFPNKVVGVIGATAGYGHSAIRDISISGNKVSFNIRYGYISSSASGTNTITITAIGY